MTCAICKKCQDIDRKYIIGFRAHGVCRKTVDRKYRLLQAKHREITSLAVIEAVRRGARNISQVIHSLGYSSVCGQTIAKVKDAAPDLDQLVSQVSQQVA